MAEKDKIKPKAKRKKPGTFSSGQNSLRGKSAKTKILEALKRDPKTEADFWDLIVKKAMIDNDDLMLQLMAKKIAPDVKPVLELFKITGLKRSPTRLERAEAIVKAATDGKIPIDVAQQYLRALADVAKVEEVDSILDRIAKLEEKINQ